MRFLLFLWDISWRNILIATVAGLISGGSNAILISLINASLHRASIPNALIYFAALALLTLVTSIVSQFMLINLSQNAIYQLRLRLSQNILSSPLHHLERLGENRLLATLTDDIRVLSHSVSAIPNICIDLATVFGCLAYLALISNVLFVLTIATSAVAIWCVQTKLGKAQRLFSVAREEEDNLFKHFQAITRGTKELKLHTGRREDFTSKNLHGSAAKLRQKNSTAMKSFAIANGLGQFSQVSSLALILFVLPLFLHVPMPMLATYVLTSSYLSVPLQNLLRRLPDLLQGNVALKKIEMMKLSLVNQAEMDTTINSYIIRQPGQLELKLELDHVSYLYHSAGDEQGFNPSGASLRPIHQPGQGHKPKKMHLPPEDEKGFLLGPITLSLQSGQITYIVGGNGSGKSTLAKLITGLYTPNTGAIYLDGVLITDENREWYRQHFSAIFSDFYLFDSCLGFNHTNLDREVENYLQQLQLDHKVKVKDGVLSTTSLSQGQRKRLALLTAYLEDRPIYLFDEWASDQEPQFRDLFYRKTLVELKERGKAVVVITHDDRYFHLADQIIKLDYGKIEPHYIPTTSYLG